MIKKPILVYALMLFETVGYGTELNAEKANDPNVIFQRSNYITSDADLRDVFIFRKVDCLFCCQPV